MENAYFDQTESLSSGTSSRSYKLLASEMLQILKYGEELSIACGNSYEINEKKANRTLPVCASSSLNTFMIRTNVSSYKFD